MIPRPLALLNADWILFQFGRKRVDAQEAYRQLAREGMDGHDTWDGLVEGFILGSKEFVAAVCKHLLKDDDLREVFRREKHAARPSLQQLFGAVEQTRKDRDGLIAPAHLLHGFTRLEIADSLGVRREREQSA